MSTDPDCHYGDHTYLGGGVCVRCGKRLRCYCGAFVTETGIDAHLATRRSLALASPAAAPPSPDSSEVSRA